MTVSVLYGFNANVSPFLLHDTFAEAAFDLVAVGEGRLEAIEHVEHVERKDGVFLDCTRVRRPPVTRPRLESGGRTEVRDPFRICSNQRLNDLANRY